MIRLLLWGILTQDQSLFKADRAEIPQPSTISDYTKFSSRRATNTHQFGFITFGNKIYYRCWVMCALSHMFGSLPSSDTCSSYITPFCVKRVEIKLTAPIVTSMYIFSIDNPLLFSKQINIKSILLSLIKIYTYHNLMK